MFDPHEVYSFDLLIRLIIICWATSMVLMFGIYLLDFTLFLHRRFCGGAYEPSLESVLVQTDEVFVAEYPRESTKVAGSAPKIMLGPVPVKARNGSVEMAPVGPNTPPPCAMSTSKAPFESSGSKLDPVQESGENPESIPEEEEEEEVVYDVSESEWSSTEESYDYCQAAAAAAAAAGTGSGPVEPIPESETPDSAETPDPTTKPNATKCPTTSQL
jgi:hypothetical protein